MISRQKSTNNAGVPPLPPVQPDALQIGELGSRWRFPSDHIPIAASVLGIKIGTWNVLNEKWVGFFTENCEGLAASNIITDAVPSRNGAALTKREEHTLQIATALIHRLDVLLLQECSPLFLGELSQRLPPQIRCLAGQPHQSENGIAAFYDSTRLVFDPAASDIRQEGYRCKAGKAIMNLLFRSSSQVQIRVIHTHVPGDPKVPGLDEFAEYVAQHKDFEIPTVIAGDLNFLPPQVLGVLADKGIKDILSVVRLNTHVGPGRIPKDIDQILVLNGCGADCRAITAAELSDEVAEAATLLNPT